MNPLPEIDSDAFLAELKAGPDYFDGLDDEFLQKPAIQHGVTVKRDGTNVILAPKNRRGIDELIKSQCWSRYETDDKAILLRAFWIEPTELELLKRWPFVVILDNT